MQLEIFYDRKFDISKSTRKFIIKSSPTSLHHFIRNLPVKGRCEAARSWRRRWQCCQSCACSSWVSLTVVDRSGLVADEAGNQAASHPNIQHVTADLDADWIPSLRGERFHTVFALDILEHLFSPENAVSQIFSLMQPGGKLYASTGNIAFVFIRLIHLVGHFNYGRRGILDLTHTRLFTVSSFRRLIRDAGFRIDSVRCFGPPIADLGGADSGSLRFIDRLASSLARAWKGLFGYQILIEATRPDSVDTLMSRIFLDKRKLRSAVAGTEMQDTGAVPLPASLR